MKKWKKSDKCLNCGNSIDPEFNYCPYCGQENDDRNVSFAQLTNEFFSNYLSLDSRFGRSVAPFLIRPGYLTNRFNQGKRKNYANPIRLYLIVSLFFFFFMGLYLSNHSTLFDENNRGFNLGNQNTKIDSTEAQVLKDNIIASIDQFDTLSTDQSDEVKQVLDSLDIKSKIRNFETDSLSLLPDDSSSWLTNEKWEIFNGMRKNLEYSNQDILDSLRVDEMDGSKKLITTQIVRVARSSDTFFAFVIKNMPIMMFLMLPLFAIILKLLYVRHKILYIQHLIHSLHIHSMAFFIYGMAFLISLIFNPDIIASILVISLALITVYSYISYINVYKQNWAMTLFKFLLTGYFYCILLVFAFVVEVIVSFLMY